MAAEPQCMYTPLVLVLDKHVHNLWRLLLIRASKTSCVHPEGPSNAFTKSDDVQARPKAHIKPHMIAYERQKHPSTVRNTSSAHICMLLCKLSGLRGLHDLSVVLLASISTAEKANLQTKHDIIEHFFNLVVWRCGICMPSNTVFRVVPSQLNGCTDPRYGICRSCSGDSFK